MLERRPTIMTVQEVARYLRVHAITVYRMIRLGQLPAIRVGRGWRFKKDEIDSWLHKHESNSQDQPAKPAKPRGRSTPRRRALR
ncbi:MAG: helix-turn-helix domain-containing protein [bacterium]|nr:helix-turn-helix domain-containing protein [bacterium]